MLAKPNRPYDFYFDRRDLDPGFESPLGAPEIVRRLTISGTIDSGDETIILNNRACLLHGSSDLRVPEGRDGGDQTCIVALSPEETAKIRIIDTEYKTPDAKLQWYISSIEGNNRPLKIAADFVDAANRIAGGVSAQFQRINK
jgi:hypothetical protein